MTKPPDPAEQPHLLVQVAVAGPHYKTYDYQLPAGAAAKPLQPGERVLVPFGRRSVLGIVMAINEPDDQAGTYNYKPISERLDSRPALNAEQIGLCLWAADYYTSPIGEISQLALPPPARRASANQWQNRQTEAILYPVKVSTPPRGPRQKALYELLSRQAQDGGVPVKSIRRSGFSQAVIQALVNHGAAAIAHQTLGSSQELSPQIPRTLTPEQSAALDRLRQAGRQYGCFLLEGITGSGKTEVYLQWLADSDGQALVLVPEISLTPQLLERLTLRFPGQVRVYHSDQSDTERTETWLQARDGSCKIVVGTRSAIFLPFNHLSRIIVDEEHDSSFKQQESPAYQARDLAIFRAHRLQIPVLLGSATPSAESLLNVHRGRYTHLTLSARPGGAKLPRIHLSQIHEDHRQEYLGSELKEALSECLGKNQQALLFINRRGFAPTLLCPGCGWMATCTSCDTRMTFHMASQRLRCHHCGASRPVPSVCPQCHTTAPLPVGLGTERIENELRRNFPEVPVFRFDRDVIRTHAMLIKTLEEIRQTQPCLIVGTQLLAKGHDFPGITLVGVLDADGGLFGSDFRATERHSQMIIQVAGRSGRGEAPGKVILQTRLPSHPVLQSLSRLDYGEIMERELGLRESAHLPPYGAMALIRGDAISAEACENGLTQIASQLEHFRLPGVEWHGPYPSLLARRKNRFHYVIWVTSSDRPPLLRTLRHWTRSDLSRRISRAGQFHWSIDVDPVDTL